MFKAIKFGREHAAGDYGNRVITEVLQAGLTTGVLWGLGMAFFLGADIRSVAPFAAGFGLFMGFFAAPHTLRVVVTRQPGEATMLEEPLAMARLLAPLGWELAETGASFDRYSKRSGVTDLAVGPLKLAPSNSDVVVVRTPRRNCASSTSSDSPVDGALACSCCAGGTK